jgi:outer membrane lipoprotein carrier protein
MSFLLNCLVVALGVQGPAAQPEAEALARALQQKYETVRDFSADFTHTYEGGVLRKKTVERGRVLVSKPAKMRWTYTEPEEKVFVSDGRKLYSYIPVDKQVYVSTVPPDDQAPTPMLFLSGKGNLVRDFVATATSVPDAPSGTVSLKLTPRRTERDYEWLALVVDRNTLQLRMLVSVDRQGGRSAITFANLRENTGISDREFVFKIPRGVDVITDAGRSE